MKKLSRKRFYHRFSNVLWCNYGNNCAEKDFSQSDSKFNNFHSHFRSYCVGFSVFPMFSLVATEKTAPNSVALPPSCFIKTQYINLDFKESNNFPVRIGIKIIKVGRWNLMHLLLIYENPPDFTLTILTLLKK